MNIQSVWRDLKRGYSQVDIRSLMKKIEESRKPGAIVTLTKREFKAIREIQRADFNKE
ncbi:MAG TPA: hypothetical protein VJ044_15780 [Candidatus Hodarchaeales archaeon]|nr:hypothetical protein [Candidatus Hodarchaeales archaeon]